MIFISWRLNDPADERYRPTKIHALREDVDPLNREITICGVVVPASAYDQDRRFTAGEVSCGRCARLLAARSSS